MSYKSTQLEKRSNQQPDVTVKQLMLAAAGEGRNLAFAGAVGLLTFGLALGGLPALAGIMLVFGVLVYVSLVGLDAVSPKFIEKIEAEKGIQQFQLDWLDPRYEPWEISSKKLRRLYETIFHQYRFLHQEVQQADNLVMERLTGILQCCKDLVRKAENLIERGEVLATHLNRSCTQDIEGRLYTLQAEIAKTRDKQAAENFRKAALIQKERLNSYLKMEGAYDQIVAQLNVVIASIKVACSKAACLRASDPLGSVLLNEDFEEKIETLNSEVNFLEAGIDEVTKD